MILYDSSSEIFRRDSSVLKIEIYFPTYTIQITQKTVCTQKNNYYIAYDSTLLGVIGSHYDLRIFNLYCFIFIFLSPTYSLFFSIISLSPPTFRIIFRKVIFLLREKFFLIFILTFCLFVRPGPCSSDWIWQLYASDKEPCG